MDLVPSFLNPDCYLKLLKLLFEPSYSSSFSEILLKPNEFLEDLCKGCRRAEGYCLCSSFEWCSLSSTELAEQLLERSISISLLDSVSVWPSDCFDFFFCIFLRFLLMTSFLLMELYLDALMELPLEPLWLLLFLECLPWLSSTIFLMDSCSMLSLIFLPDLSIRINCYSFISEA